MQKNYFNKRVTIALSPGHSVWKEHSSPWLHECDFCERNLFRNQPYIEVIYIMPEQEHELAYFCCMHCYEEAKELV